MGKINQSVLGGISGKIGNLVGRSWKGIHFLQTKPAIYHDAKTPKQIRVRTRFASCNKLAKSVLINIIRPVWDQKAMRMSGYTLFISTNLSAFDKELILPSYEMLKFSLGELPLPNNIAVANTTTGNGAIIITWTDNSGVHIAAPTDRLLVVALKGNEPVVLNRLPFIRSAQHATIQLPYSTGETVHTYVFFESEKGTIYSDSFYSSLTIS
jgi:hypothetical protein